MPAFWFHYNRPAAAAAGSPKMTVHYRQQCMVVDHVECHVPVRTRHRNTQPHVVMAGRGCVRVSGGTAHITRS